MGFCSDPVWLFLQWVSKNVLIKMYLLLSFPYIKSTKSYWQLEIVIEEQVMFAFLSTCMCVNV